MAHEQYQFRTPDEFNRIIGPNKPFLSTGYRNIQGSRENATHIEAQSTAPKVLYIDGITSAGKTTTLTLLQKEMPEVAFIPEFSLDIPPAYQNIGPNTTLVDQLRSQFWFYNQYRKKEEEIKRLSGRVIVDRGLLGLFCYSNLLGEENTVSSRVMWRALQQEWTPGLYIFLTARPEVLGERLVARKDSGNITREAWLNGMGNFIQALHRSVEDLVREAGVHLIDTSDKSPEMVAEEVKGLYEQYCATE